MSEGTSPLGGELQDATIGGSFESVFTVGYMSWISMVEVWVIATGDRGCWPFDTDELVVSTVDVAAMGHSASESADGARGHHFLLNK